MILVQEVNEIFQNIGYLFEDRKNWVGQIFATSCITCRE